MIRSAYVHVPFCQHRCGYCNFTLLAGRLDLANAFLDALERELRQRLSAPWPVETLFIGGGTPTYLPLPQLRRLLDLLSHWLPVCSGGEFTVEANPSDCTRDVLQLLRHAGVNRLSVGGQSFSAHKLRMLERTHAPEELAHALELARTFFANVSLDLIFAAPGESTEDWRADLEAAIGCGVQHLSTYGLTIERGAAFYGRMLRGDLAEVADETQLEMYQTAIETMTDRGWEHYEISSFAQPGYVCRHNHVYWSGDFWWGFGPGAAGFLPATEPRSACVGYRQVNHRSTLMYLRKCLGDQDPMDEREAIHLEQWLRERLVFGLRRISGVDLAQLQPHWTEPVEALFEPHLSRFVAQGWLSRQGSRVQLTPAGLVISDSLWPDLLAPSRAASRD